MKPPDLHLSYKKIISFTKQQQKSLKTLKDYGVNVNEFIRIAVREKIKREWPEIKEKHKKEYCPF